MSACGRVPASGQEALDDRAAFAGDAEALALVLAARARRELAVAEPEARIVDADVERQRVRGRRPFAPGRDVQQQTRRPARAPRRARAARGSGSDRPPRRTPRGRGSPRRCDGRGSAVARRSVRSTTSGWNVRITHTTSASASSCPQIAERLRGGLRVAEVAHAGEALAGAVDAAGREQLLGADDVEQLVLLDADEILAAAAAGHRQVGGGHVALDWPGRRAGACSRRRDGRRRRARATCWRRGRARGRAFRRPCWRLLGAAAVLAAHEHRNDCDRASHRLTRVSAGRASAGRVLRSARAPCRAGKRSAHDRGRHGPSRRQRSGRQAPPSTASASASTSNGCDEPPRRRRPRLPAARRPGSRTPARPQLSASSAATPKLSVSLGRRKASAWRRSVDEVAALCRES